MAEKRNEYGEFLFDDAEQDTEYIEESGYKECIAIMIDCQPAMWQPCTLSDKSLAGKTWLEACIIGAASVLRQRTLEGGDDDVGVYFFNLGASAALEAANEQGYPNVYCLQELESPTADRVRQLQALNPASIGQGSAAPADRTRALSTALWAAASALPGLGKLKTEAGVATFGAQRVMVFTCDPDPTDGGADGADITAPLDKAKNIGLKGGTLELVPLMGQVEEFDLEPFWGPMLERQTAARATVHKAAPSAAQASLDDDDRVVSFRSLSEFVRARGFKKRAQARMHWSLGPGGPAIGVKLFATVRLATRGAITYVHAEDNEPLVRESARFDTSTGTRLENSVRPVRYYPKAPKDKSAEEAEKDREKGKQDTAPRLSRVFVTDDDLHDVKNPVPKGLELVGFRRRSALAPWHQLRVSAFLRPDEAAVSGSTAAFAALLDACIARDRVAVAMMVRVPSAEPALVALLPQAERFDPVSGEQLASSGFHVISLPWAEDLRWPERDLGFVGAGPAAPAPAAVAAAGAVVDCLRLEDFESTALSDPAMQRFLKVLEAKALMQPLPGGDPRADDATAADPGEGFPQDLVDDFLEAVCEGTAWNMEELQGAALNKKATGGKRAAAGPPAPADQNEGYTDEELAGMALGTNFTATQLKGLLRKRELPVSGKKAELVERLRAHLAGSSGG